MREQHKGNGVATVCEMLDNASEVQPRAPLDEVDVAELKVKHRDLIAELDRLAEMKRKADAGEIEHPVFEAERLALAEKYKKQGMTPAKALAAVEQRLRPPMGADEAKRRLAAEGGSQRDEVLQLGFVSELWHDADYEAFATIRRNGRRETWKVRSRDYRLYLIAEYRRRYGRVPANQALLEGIDAIEATARDGARRRATAPNRRSLSASLAPAARSILTWSTTARRG